MSVPGCSMTFFDEAIASTYDHAVRARFEPSLLDVTTDYLADLAGNGAALEFAIGTGRVALPLQAKGVPVHGIEFSQPMLDHMLPKHGADSIPVTVGDMATVRVEGDFSLVYLVFNTLSNLLTQDEQVQCFENAAAHLGPGGYFVVELNVPPLQRLNPGETVLPFDIRPDHLGFEEIDTATQIGISHHYYPPTTQPKDAGTKQTRAAGQTAEVGQTVTTTHRFAWPAELDLMARIAGMRLHSRHADFARSTFTSSSRSHVSTWVKL